MKKERVLIAALLFSAVWHIFWLSAVSVVVAPKAAKQVKFSGVSFLGPILDMGVFKTNIEPRERTMPEKRYLAYAASLYRRAADESDQAGYWQQTRPDEGVLPANDAGSAAMFISAIDTRKLEPGREIE
jgi:hypothetical protein